MPDFSTWTTDQLREYERKLLSWELGKPAPPLLPGQASTASLPRIFRILGIVSEGGKQGAVRNIATLFHEHAEQQVSWYGSSCEDYLKPGVLVAASWQFHNYDPDETVPVRCLRLLSAPSADSNLFRTIPCEWVADRDLVSRGGRLFAKLNAMHRSLFNAIFWDSERFHRFCTAPSSLRDHHSTINGNLRHSVEVAEVMLKMCDDRPTANQSLAVLLGLLHDAGKADEYFMDHQRRWRMTDRGRLLGHKETLTEWIHLEVERHRVPLDARAKQELIHCLVANPHAPEWLGIRKPAKVESVMLSMADQCSAKTASFDRGGYAAAGNSR